MFKGILASIGIGGAKVDTILDNAQVTVGDTLSGRIQIVAGSVAQPVNNIHLELITLVEREVNDTTVREARVIASWATGDAMTYQPGQRDEIPFQIDVPLHTPLYVPGADVRVWLRTRLEIPGAADPTDDDAIYACPRPEQAALFDAMQMLGFQLAKSDVEHRGFGYGFMQEFEFRPATYGRANFDEIEVVFQPAENGFDMLVQVDRAARGWGGYWAEANGFDESWYRVNVPWGCDAHGIAQAIQSVLR